jgi:hypothetical protein
VQYLALGLALLPVAALAGWWLWLRDRRQRAESAARIGAEVDASIERFRATASTDTADRAQQDAQIIAEELKREPPNSDLARDDVRERLLRAAAESGGDEARAQLEKLLDAHATVDAKH